MVVQLEAEERREEHLLLVGEAGEERDVAAALAEAPRLLGVLAHARREAEAVWALADAATAAAEDLPGTKPIVEASAPHLRTLRGRMRKRGQVKTKKLSL